MSKSDAERLIISDLIKEYSLQHHPFEGWWRKLADGQHGYDWLLEGTDHVPWHRYPATVTITMLRGDPLIVSVSDDDVTAISHTLFRGQSYRLEKGNAVTLSAIGRWSMCTIETKHALNPTERVHLPDDWFPSGLVT